MMSGQMTGRRREEAVEGDWEDESDPPSGISLAVKHDETETRRNDGEASVASSSSRTSAPPPSTPTKRSSSSSALRKPVTPRRRQPARAAIRPSGIPREKRSSAPPPARSPQPQSPGPSAFAQALSLFASLLRAIWSIFDLLITPIKPYLLLGGLIFAAVYLTYCTLIYYALPRFPSLMLWGLGRLIRPLGGGWLNIPLPTWDALHIAHPSDADVNRGLALLTLPLSGLATTSCALFGVGCDASLLSTSDVIAGPIWRRGTGKSGVLGVQDAQIAWALAQEGRTAKTIFDSVATLGNKADIFQHIELWKHGVAVTVESKLEERKVLGRQLYDLSGLSKDLHDEMRGIDSMTVMTFGNLHLEFSDLTVQLLDPAERISNSLTLAKRFDNVLTRLNPNLDELIARVERAVGVAQLALDQGKQITLNLRQISNELESEIASEPVWKRGIEEVNHFIKGGDAPRTRVIRRDLRLVENVVDDVVLLLRGLENARTGLLDYRSHTSGFKASLYGVHLAANGTLELEDELRILAPIMEEFGMAVDEAKGRRLGGREVTARRIEQGRD